MRRRLLDEHPALFRSFADLDLTPASVLEFITRHGFLEWPVESLSKWYFQIERMRKCVREWENGRKRGDLSQLVHQFNDKSLLGETGILERLTARIHLPSDPGAASFGISPPTLLSALWLQFALTICNQRQLRQCKYCCKWYPYGAGTGKRQSGHFCTQRCYQAHHYRMRKGKQIDQTLDKGASAVRESSDG